MKIILLGIAISVANFYFWLGMTQTGHPLTTFFMLSAPDDPADDDEDVIK